MVQITKWLILFSFLLLEPSQALAGPACAQIYSQIGSTQATNIGFSQNYLGHVWAKIKVKNLRELFRDWKPERGRKTKQKFIDEYTQLKPFPVFKDVSGQLRIMDNHHRFFSITRFMGKGNFEITYKLKKDYTLPNPATGKRWTQKEMMDDLVANNYIFIPGKANPRFSDLKKLPKNIEDLVDLPIRTILSLALESFDLPMKGSDFTPMIQLLLGDKMITMGFKVLYDKPYAINNIRKIRKDILNSKELLRFLLERLKTTKDPLRVKELQDFFSYHLDSLNQAP